MAAKARVSEAVMKHNLKDVSGVVMSDQLSGARSRDPQTKHLLLGSVDLPSLQSAFLQRAELRSELGKAALVVVRTWLAILGMVVNMRTNEQERFKTAVFLVRSGCNP